MEIDNGKRLFTEEDREGFSVLELENEVVRDYVIGMEFNSLKLCGIIGSVSAVCSFLLPVQLLPVTLTGIAVSAGLGISVYTKYKKLVGKKGCFVGIEVIEKLGYEEFAGADGKKYKTGKVLARDMETSYRGEIYPPIDMYENCENGDILDIIIFEDATVKSELMDEEEFKK